MARRINTSEHGETREPPIPSYPIVGRLEIMGRLYVEKIVAVSLLGDHTLLLFIQSFTYKCPSDVPRNPKLAGEDMIRTAQECVEVGRNALPTAEAA